IGAPYSSTFSVAIAAPRLVDQCGSEYVRRARSPARSSAHSGWMRATSRAHSRDVSTSSPAMIHAGGFLLSGEPGKIANRAPRAPGRGARAAARPRPRRLAELARHDPRRRLLAERRAGEDREPRAARTGVLVAGLLLRAPQRLGAGLALEVRDRRRLDLARV